MRSKSLVLPESGFNKDYFSLITVNEIVTVGVSVNGKTNDITITLEQLRQLNDFTGKHLNRWEK